MNLRTVNAHPSLRYFAFVVLVSAASMTQVAYGESKTIAMISAVSGPVQVIGKSVGKQAEKGAALSESDSIKTEKGGIAQIKFNDGSSFTIYENSSIRIEHYKKRPAGERGLAETTFDVLNGKLKFFVNPKAKEKANTKFRTKTAVMGIRGTSGIISVGTDGATQLVVLTGLVEVKNPKIPELSVSVAPNYSTKIGSSSAPEAPAPVSREDIKNLLPEVPKGAEFTEDGPSTIRPQSPEAPANEQKQQERPTEDKESGSKAPVKDAGDGKESVSTSPSQPKKDERAPSSSANRAPIQSRPIFAPGGSVVNRNTSGTEVSPSSLRGVGTIEGGTQAPAKSESVARESTAEEVLSAENQQSVVQQNVVTPTRVVNQIQTVIERTVDETQAKVQERVVEPVLPVKQPQKVKVNISLPGD
ncbi:MAG: hypothetical protein RL189_1774 [Pseudomonadota bacterium]|jgi:hypothetical protein